MQANDSIMSGYFCIGFINFMLKNKGLLSYPKFNKCRKIFSVFSVINIEKLKNLTCHTFLIKH